MRGKISISFLLTFVMFFSQVSVSFANEIKFSAKNTENSLKVHNEFIEKTANKYKDDDQVEIIVTLKDDKEELLKAMKNDYSQKKIAPYTKAASINYYEAERQAKLYKPQTVLKPTDEHGVVNTVRYNLATQNLFEYALDNKGYRFEIINHIDYIFNGIGIKTNYKTAKEIAKLQYVELVEPVVEYKRVEPIHTEMHTSTSIIKANNLNKIGYTGKGTVAAVLDTGLWHGSESKIKPEFKDDKLDKTALKLKAEEAKALIAEINSHKKNNADAFYINNKIPFAKDYYKFGDSEIIDITNDHTSHGTHVSGILVANGDPEQNQIRGVAPDAQLLFMQVFNEVGGATGSNFIAEAINDAIKLKADTINMSLSMGNVGNTRSGDKIIENAINKATSAGITVAVAAGNYGSSAYPKLEVRRDNFDYGTLRDMAAFENSFSVASFNNEKLYTNYLKIVGSEVIVPVYLTDGFAGAAISNNFNREEEKELEVIDAGIGTDEDFKRLKEQGVKFEGKAVIMRRQPGTLYVTKVGNAKKYGALLAIVYNNVGDELQSMGVGDYSSSMPSLFIGQKAGEEIVKTKAKVVLGKGSIVIDNPNKGKMSDFSSWGATIDLGFKPEITAPGEGIYSTNTGAPDEYISMNGTSMASPHIAGASLILRQYLKDKAPELANRDDISYVVKNIMMSTAKPVIEPLSNVEYSPRKEGAGLVDLKAATETRVYAYEKNTKESKVNLKELQENESFDIDLKNFGDTTASYKVSLVINTDLVNENHITLRPRRISEQDIGRIDVKPKSIAEQKVTINVSKEEQRKLIEDMPNGFWIEGFVYFKSEKPEEYPDLSIPFISLKTKGNLNAGAVGVIEPLIYDLNKGLNNLNMFYNEKNNEEVGRYQSYSPIEQYKTIGLEVGGTLENLKARKDKIAISPNGDGISDNIMPKLVLNRYISRIFFGIEKDGKNIIETSAMSGSKLDQFKGVFFNSNLILTVNDDIKDGEYDLVTTAITDYSEAGIRNESSDYENDEKYVLKNKIIIDRNKPRVTKVEVFGNKAILNFTDQYPEFKGSGVKLVEIKDKSPGNIIAIKDDQTSLSIILPEGKTVKDTKVAIEDWAGNRLEGTIEELKEKTVYKAINVVPIVTNSAYNAKGFSYTIINKMTNQKVEDDKLIAGTYIVKVTDLTGGLELVDEREKEVVLKDEDISKTVFFKIFRPEDANRDKVDTVTLSYLKGFNGSENYDPKKIKITATNLIGQEFEFKQSDFNELEFINDLNLGKVYNFKISLEDSEYIAVPSEFSTKLSYKDQVRTFQVYKKTDKLLDTVDINVKYEFEESNIYPIDNKFVQLLVNGVAPKYDNGYPKMGTRIEIDFSNKGTFYNMPKYDSSGNIINYDIQAQYNRRHDYELAGYNKDWELDKIEKVSDYNFVIKYKLTEKSRTEGKAGNYNPKVDVSVKANWEGEYIDKNNLPDVYFKLMNGNKIVKGPTKLEYGKDTLVWKDLPKEKDGLTIYYSVEMVNADGSPWKAENFEGGRIIRRGNTNEEDINSFNFSVTNSFIKKRGNRFITKEIHVR